jgi:hypothetical protein
LLDGGEVVEVEMEKDEESRRSRIQFLDLVDRTARSFSRSRRDIHFRVVSVQDRGELLADTSRGSSYNEYLETKRRTHVASAERILHGVFLNPTKPSLPCQTDPGDSLQSTEVWGETSHSTGFPYY